MQITSKQINKLTIIADKMDLISVFIDDIAPSKGQITIICYGSAWTAFWGATGTKSVAEFFSSCDEHYLAKNFSNIKSEKYDLEQIQQAAADKDVECWRDDPWNDYDFMAAMYGPDMFDWHDSLPKKPNPEYKYLCRILKTVQQALKQA